MIVNSTQFKTHQFATSLVVVAEGLGRPEPGFSTVFELR